MGYITVGEYHLIDLMLSNKIFKLFLRMYRHPIGIELPGEGRWVSPTFNVGDLGGGESCDFVLSLIAEVHIEVMEITTCGAHDENSLRLHCVG
jgi:hypothetical protein